MLLLPKRPATSAAPALLVIATAAAHLYAQPLDAREDDAPATGPTLNAEEIVVTARKRAESLQEVPLSVTALTADQLQRVGAVNNEDVALLTPNFNTVRQIGRRLDRPTIRGQSAAAVGGEPNASYFIDGVAVAGSVSTTSLGPIERVEILRGPQSAQFGRATFAGAINYVTRRPTDEFTGEARGRVGTHDTRLFSAWASGPVVSDQLYYFVAGGFDQYGGDWNNNLQADMAPPLAFVDPPQFGDSSELGGTQTQDAVIKLLWTPTDGSEIIFKAGLTKGDDDHYVQLLQEPGELNCFLPTDGSNGTDDNSAEPWYTTSKGQFCGKLDPKKVRYVDANPFSPTNPGFNSATYFPRPGGFPGGINPLVAGLPVQGGPRQARVNLPDLYTGMQLPDFSALPPAAQEALFGRVTQPQDWVAIPREPGIRRTQKRFLLEYSQDMGEWSGTARLAYNDDSFDQALDLDRTEQRYLTGLFTNYVEDETEDYSVELRVDSPADSRLRGSAGVYYFDAENRSRTQRFVGIVGLGQLEQVPLISTVANSALFGTLEYSLSDAWTLSGELRYARDEKEIIADLFCKDANDPNFERQARDTQVTKALTPRFTVRYEPSDTVMLYALAAKGNKPAEFERSYFRTTADGCQTAERIDAGIARIEEETAWTYETGTKTTWMDGRVLANLSVFYINWRNQSVFETEEINGTLTQVTKNAGKSKVWGAELETSYAFTDKLIGRFSWGLANGTFTRYNNRDYAQTTGIGLVIDPLTGQPARTATGALIYDDDANNVAGNRLPSSPKHSFVTALDYSSETLLNLGNGDINLDWFARTDFILETDRYSSATNFTKFPNRKLWNARIGLEQSNWTLTASVYNILDDQTPTAIFGFEVIGGLTYNNGRDPITNLPDGSVGRTPNMNSVSPPMGREYNLELVYRFGN